MRKFSEEQFSTFLERNVLLYGETNTKKTYYTAKFVQYLLEDQEIDPVEISILDFAPELKRINGLKVGGKIEDYFIGSTQCNYILLKEKIRPPRLDSKDKRELFKHAKKNYELTKKALKTYHNNPTKFLIINDISIHLHCGKVNDILRAVRKSKSFFGNSYFGTSIAKDYAYEFSKREREMVEKLEKRIEITFKLH